MNLYRWRRYVELGYLLHLELMCHDYIAQFLCRITAVMHTPNKNVESIEISEMKQNLPAICKCLKRVMYRFIVYRLLQSKIRKLKRY
jgi:hypothetical protein